MTPFKYQKTGRYTAQTPGGLETIAASELKSLGAKEAEPGFRTVEFTADPEVLYRINYKARLVTRVIAPLTTFKCRDRDDLYRAGRSIDWPSFFTNDNTFGVFSNVSENHNLIHSQYAALCLKDAVVDLFRDKTGRRPDVNKTEPDVWINLHIKKERGTIGLDTSGGSLHRRGYRRKSVQAPLQEVLAASMVSFSEWKGDIPVYDPMCGSGTLLCESLIYACRIPPGFFRENFGFRHLPDFDPKIWKRVKAEADALMKTPPEGLISGSDMDAEAIRAARTNCGVLPGGGRISLSKKHFKNIESLENRIIFCNPPYGVRMGREAELGMFYKDFGDFLKQRCKGSVAYIYFGVREMLKSIGLKPAFKKPVRNAGLDGRVAKFELY